MSASTDHQNSLHLITRAKEGDASAYGELYESHRLSVYRYLYYRTGDTQTADDLTSEVFLRMIRFLSGYRFQDAPFQAWLFRIAHNLLNDHYRKTNGRQPVQLEENVMDNPLHGRSRPVEHSLNSVTLQQALEMLSGEQREVIVMRFITGMSIAEVARALHKTEDAVKGLQRRALSNLRSVLAGWEIDYAEL
jgi:RNA polymerase sigma-70 factor (ECF subfamily)